MAATAKTVKDVQSHEFVRAYAAHLKRTGKIELPPWHDLVKTAAFKELCPLDADWYYVRAASIARHIYLRGGVGVGGLKKRFGGKSNRGVRPGHYCKASGSVQRHVMQQLEALKILEKHPNGGRRITSDGQRDLDRIAGRIEDSKEPSPLDLIQPAAPPAAAPAAEEETAA